MNDRRLAWAAAFLGAAPFFATVPFCGLYLDDYSFLRMLEGSSAAELWTSFIHYVPGRNLHIPFFYALIELTGRSVSAMHLVGLAFDALNAALLFLLVRRLTGLGGLALAAAAAFAVAPNHGETHFWITLIPQCQIPTALILGAFLLAARGALAPACAVYALALFTYDQVFFLWPLLLLVARRGGAKRLVAAAAALLSLNIVHIALRYLSPYASGGRPLIRIGDFFHRCWDAAVAVEKGVIPWPTSSHAHWAWSVPAAALSILAAYWLLRVVRARSRAEAEELAAWTKGRGWFIAASGGLAWTALAYLPNLFWYLSPRHNLLPSIGWSLTAVSLGAYAVARGGRAAKILPGLAALFFAVAAVSDVHEGTQWIDSRRLRDSFARSVRGLTPPVESVFLSGAPRSLRRAPAFNLPHDVIMAAGRALGTPMLNAGDYQLSPTRRGVVYLNDLSVGPPETFRWLPAASANLLVYEAATRSFACASALSVSEPGGAVRRLDLRANRDCARVEPVIADVSLAASSAGPAAPSSLSAAASIHGDVTTLELVWRVDRIPRAPLAFLPRVEDASGKLLLDTVFPSRGAKRPYPMVWPLVDDLAPGLPLRLGGALRQTWRIRRAPSSLPAGAVLKLDVFEISPAGVPARLGSMTAPLALRAN